MQLAFSPLVCPLLRLPEMLALAKQAGFARLELFRDRTESTPVHADFSVPMVRDSIREKYLELSAFNIRPLTGRKADSDERNLHYNLRQLEWDIHLGRALGTKNINLVSGARTQEALEDLVQGVNQLLERVPDVSLNLGNRLGTCLQEPGDYGSVLPQLNGRARLLLDTGQLLAAGQDVLRFAEEFSSRLGQVHLGDRKGERPAPLGQGDLPLAELLSLLRQAGYHGHLVIALEELDDPLSAVVAARRRVEELL
jgi:sugar phosphate isomerase/epimerase